MTKKKPPETHKPNGRPRKPIDTDKLRQDLANGLTKEEALKIHGLNPDHSTVREKKDPQLARAVREGPEEFKIKFAEAIKPMLISAYRQKIMDGDVAAILYGMRNIVGFTEKRALEVSGEVSHVHSLSAEDRSKRIAELRRELESAVDVQLIEEKSDDSQ